MKKTEKEKKSSLFYLKRLRSVGIIGIVISVILIGIDIYTFEKGWLSILSFIVDALLIIFSIFFILKSRKLTFTEENVKTKKKKWKKTIAVF